MRVRGGMSRGCRIGAWDDVVFGSLVLRLRGTIDPFHEGNHTCTHSVPDHQLMILISLEAGKEDLLVRGWNE